MTIDELRDELATAKELEDEAWRRRQKLQTAYSEADCDWIEAHKKRKEIEFKIKEAA